MIRHKTIIVGFGFSTLSLLRELELRKEDYIIISTKQQDIWTLLEKADRLDFDLVSSRYTSMYSYELASDLKSDHYPTSTEYSSFIKKHKANFIHKVKEDFVTKIENYEDHNILYTKSGETYYANYVAIGTNFERGLNGTLLNYDFDSAKKKTIVMNCIGDTANLILAKLLPRGNKMILVNDGMISWDKVFSLDRLIADTYGLSIEQSRDFLRSFTAPEYRKYLGKTVELTLDQGEVCNMHKNFPVGYNLMQWASTMTEYIDPSNRLFALGKLAGNNQHTMRKNNFAGISDMLYNIKYSDGVIPGPLGIKYWPIDAYMNNFGDNLKDSIKKGYLLNDIAYFISEGGVKNWPKKGTFIDRKNKVVTYKGKSIKYDDIIEFTDENPRIPNIDIIRGGVRRSLQTQTPGRFFLGVLPLDIDNIFFLGIARPSTGGLNNLVEMQCLFVNEMITNPVFYSDINKRKDELYNDFMNKRTFRQLEEERNSSYKSRDYLFYYGHYTAYIAELLGIDMKFEAKDWFNIDSILKYYMTPNNAFKYRQSGKYKIEGGEKLFEVSYQTNKAAMYSSLMLFLSSYLYYPVVMTKNPALGAFHHLFNPRFIFNDTRPAHKRKYKEKFKEYCKLYNEVENERREARIAKGIDKIVL